MSKLEKPILQGPYDEHPETQLNSEELGIADSDKRVAAEKQRAVEFDRIRREPETPAERAYRLDQLSGLSQRYGGKESQE